MADMYNYGGVKLAEVPSMPEGCNYGLIFHDEEDSCYYWFCSSAMFLSSGGNYLIPATATYGGNSSLEGLSYWGGATFTPIESDTSPDYYIVANSENIVWSSVDIYEKGTTTIVFSTVKPLQYPTISFTGSSQLYYIGEDADTLVCDATVNDGGILSWVWYEGDTLVGIESSFTPLTDVSGEKSYYCIVTNTTEGQRLSTTSQTITIRVKAFFPIAEFVGWCVAGLCGMPQPLWEKELPLAYLQDGILYIMDANATQNGATLEVY